MGSWNEEAPDARCDTSVPFLLVANHVHILIGAITRSSFGAFWSRSRPAAAGCLIGLDLGDTLHFSAIRVQEVSMLVNNVAFEKWRVSECLCKWCKFVRGCGTVLRT